MPVSIELVPDEGMVESGATSKVHAWFASNRRRCSRVFMARCTWAQPMCALSDSFIGSDKKGRSPRPSGAS